VPVLLVFAVVPFGGTLLPQLFRPPVPGAGRLLRRPQLPDADRALDAGMLFVLAFAASASSARCWRAGRRTTSSRCWVLRAGSQMISYELAMGLTVLAMVVSTARST
jgi:NADH-quinone oxidoreductase subunit H